MEMPTDDKIQTDFLSHSYHQVLCSRPIRCAPGLKMWTPLLAALSSRLLNVRNREVQSKDTMRSKDSLFSSVF